MNQRLQSIYDGFASQNRQKFLDNDIEFDAMWGKPIKGITLQIDLSEKMRSAVGHLQKTLSELEPKALLLTPRPFQHISFNQVVFWGGQYNLGHDQAWEVIEKNFLTAFQKLDNKFPSFTISFINLIPMTSAIIWSAVDQHDEMQRLRTRLKASLPFPKETTKENTFIHTTVTRYMSKLRDPQQVFKLLEEYQAPISMEIKEIILRKENIYPSLGTTELARIRLQ
ncbi:MAG: hypothetical protein AAB557_04565 [Patescibacteria group bacterium]